MDDQGDDDLSDILETFSTNFFLKKYMKIRNSQHRSEILKILQNLRSGKSSDKNVAQDERSMLV